MSDSATKDNRRLCVSCGAQLPAHEPTCPLRVFERDHSFGSEYDDNDEGESNG